MSTGATDSAVPLKSPTILVVDDDATLRGLLQRALENAGYRVIAVADGKAAKRQVTEIPVDLVVTDVYMPEGDGVDLVIHLRRVLPVLPVIAMSASYRGGFDPMLRVVRNLGVRRTLEKPFTLQLLLEAVRETLERTN